MTLLRTHSRSSSGMEKLFFSTWINSKTAFDVFLWSQGRISFLVALGVTHSLWMPTRILCHFYFFNLCAVREETALRLTLPGVMIIILRTLHPSQTYWSSLKRVKRIPPYLCIRIHSRLSPNTDWSDYSQQSDPNSVRGGPRAAAQCWQHLQKLHAVVAHFSNPNSKKRHVQRNYHQQKPYISETKFIYTGYSDSGMEGFRTLQIAFTSVAPSVLPVCRNMNH